MGKQFRGLLFFMVLFFLPFIPVVTSLVSLRNAVILDQKVDWKQGEKIVITLPQASFDHYEFRLESLESKWEPLVNARWSLLDDAGTVISSSAPEGNEWLLSRPMVVLVKTPDQTLRSLEIEFLNSNPENYEVRLKVSQDRSYLLEKSERLFIVLLALSLGLLLVVRRPFQKSRLGKDIQK